jgi:hypothetical protein
MKRSAFGGAVLFLTLLSYATVALAYRGRHNTYNHRAPPPVATSTPPVVPPKTPTSTPPVVLSNPTSTPSTPLQFGTFTNGAETKYGTITGFFIGDGDSFSQDVAALKISGNLWVYWESNYTATQIANGSADSFLKVWASDMKSYGKTVHFAPLDEMNGNWDPYSGNPTEFKLAWIHIYNLFSGDTNVQFSFDPNNGPTNTIASYYPGSQYVSTVGIDGFDFGNSGNGNIRQTFAQVFDSALTVVAQFGKPIWLTSVGVTSIDNQTQFIKDMFASVPTYKIQGIIYFNSPGIGGTFSLSSSAISTLQSLL